MIDLSKGYGFNIGDPNKKIIVIAKSAHILGLHRIVETIVKDGKTYVQDGFVLEDDFASDNGGIDTKKLAESLKVFIRDVPDGFCMELAEKRFAKNRGTEWILVETDTDSYGKPMVEMEIEGEYKLNEECTLKILKFDI